jgi:hypothetical protein
LLSGKNGSQSYRNIVDMAYGCIYNIYPNLAVRSGCDRVRRQILADFAPMNTLGFVNSKDKRSVYDGFEEKLRKGKIKNGVLVETLVDREPPVLRRHSGIEVVFLIIISLYVGSDESRGLSQNWVYTVEIVFVLCIEILPP